MARFEQSYPSEHTPEDLWRAVNTPLIDPELASLVHEDLLVRYDRFDVPGQIGLGTTITYVVSEAGREKVPALYRAMIPEDVDFYVTRMSDGFDPEEGAERHDVLVSGKADGSVTRRVEPEGEGSRLVVEAELTIAILKGMFDDKIAQALEYGVGQSSENTIALVPDILAA